ncbi:hypothetical protein D4764_08G0010800 [Takifugu flavidus]|uniref:Uncharacterized protein n=1 Tax=Takifugu flavidus TaxID=433684 RepID=A0A5C6MQB5_9TELE|nr:hypothetical protein D4764_08G0010800 [Takifugu flavidus]
MAVAPAAGHLGASLTPTLNKREQERKVYRSPASVRWSHRSSSWSGGAAATWKFCEILQSPPPCEDLLHG